jgi:hypothetical protein
MEAHPSVAPRKPFDDVRRDGIRGLSHLTRQLESFESGKLHGKLVNSNDFLPFLPFPP